MELKDRVYKLTAKIPKGKVVTYKMIAAKLGSIYYARAVGNALRKNRDFAKIPCHRVVCSDGSVGGYVLGTEKKIKKLQKEGVEINRGKVVNLSKYITVINRN